MRKLILEEWMSLDGYASDRNGGLDFFGPSVRPSYENAKRLAFLEAIDTLILGRRTYQQFVGLWPDRPTEQDALAKKINTVQKIVFSRTLNDAPWGQWKAAEIERGKLYERITALKVGQGKDIVVWGSLTIAQNLMKKDLIDDYHLHLCPVLTGGGAKLFTSDISSRSLQLVTATCDSQGTVHLHYQKPNVRDQNI